jgi:serine/threonine protein kinase
MMKKNLRLDWEKRVEIACEVASALAYLHFSVSPPIYHRDVKSSNILLDAELHAKVADFGLSRLVPADATHVSTGPQGTPGYVDPEYHQCYQVSDKSDVFSFGVVLLELLSGKRAVDVSRPRADVNLSSLAIDRIQKGAMEELFDPEIIAPDGDAPRSARLVGELAFRCIALERRARPDMKEVFAELDLIRSQLSQTSS